MNTAVMVVGLITLVSLSIGILILCYSYLNNLREENEKVRFTFAKEKSAKEIGQNLRNASWWFSESVEATRVLDIVGNANVEAAVVDGLVNRFLAWPLPTTVGCVTLAGNPNRTGGDLLTDTEARQMIQYLLEGVPSV